MKKIGIIICGRYQTCGGGKCFRALRERAGAFAAYAGGEAVEVVGFANCGGCPGGNIENVPAEMKKNGAQAIHLATCFVVGYPPCRDTRKFKEFIETAFDLPVVIGTHPIPLKYYENHQKLPFWQETKMGELAAGLLAEDRRVMENYN
jgi:predicted metal-binding protein